MGLELLGGVLSLFGAGQQKKAMQAQANAIRDAARIQAESTERLAAPFTDAANWSMPLLKGATIDLFGSKVGKKNPFLEAMHGENLEEIDKEKSKATASSDFFWKGSGNLGRGRGEQLRIGQSATDAKNRENLSYGMAETADQDKRIADYFNALGSMASYGQAGLAPMLTGIQNRYQGDVEAAGVKAGATTGMWGDFGLLLGDYVGRQNANEQSQLFRDMWAQSFNTPTATKKKKPTLWSGGGTYSNMG
jgi:hypothetical protein